MGNLAKIVKIFSLVFLVFVVVLSVIGFAVIRDASKFKNNFATSPSLFLLTENSRILAGSLMAESTQKEVSSDDISKYQSYFGKKDYESILGNNYKLFIIHMSAFDSVSNKIFENEILKKDDIVNALRSESARSYVIERSIEVLNVSEADEDKAFDIVNKSIPSEDALRYTFFMLLLSAGLDDDSLFLLRKYRSGDIEIYPETMLFRFVKHSPESVMSKIELKMQSEK